MNDVFSLLQKPLIRYLHDTEIKGASHIQELAIPIILEGKNILVIAPTGMGKTLAAILPIFDLFLKYRSKSEAKGISILYITPLRALNRDIYRRVMELGKELNISVEVRHGDTPSRKRRLQAMFPPNMLITTPETLQAILPGKKMREHLKSVQWIIVDEIHELVPDKRGTQLALALERLCNLTKREIQRIGLSATIGESEKAANFLAGVGRAVEVVKSPELKNFDINIEYIDPSQNEINESEKYGIPANYLSRIKKIVELTLKHKSTLIFTNTRENAEALGSLIHSFYKNLQIGVHHGSLSREIREDVEKQFQEGILKAVICTSSLELGIDVGTVELVIQYMSPRQATKLIQRVGRSGHAIESIPRGEIITGWADDILESIILLKQSLHDDLERLVIYPDPYDILTHQIVGLILDEKRITIQKAFKVITKAYPYKDLIIEQFHEVLKQIERLNLIRIIDGVLQVKTLRAYRYYFENLSVIPDVKHFTVFDFFSKRKIGTLDQEFVVKRCSSGIDIIMHGHTWKVISKDESKLTLDVEPTSPSLEAIPSWEGEIIPVEFKTAIEVGKLRQFVYDNLANLERLNDFEKKAKISHDSIRKIMGTIQDQTKFSQIPTDKKIIIERFENSIVIHACFGNFVNETIGLALTTLLRSKYNASFRYQVDPYRIAITCFYPINPIVIKELISNLDPKDLPSIVSQSLQEADMFVWRHWHVARRFGIIERRADYNTNNAKKLVDIFRDSLINEETKKEILIDKLDIENTQKILNHIVKRDILIDIIVFEDIRCSPLAIPILDKIVPHDLLRPATVSKPLSNIVEERLLSEMVKLVCTYKGDWEGVRVVKQLDEKISCRKCGTTLVAVTHPDDNDLLKIINKKKRKARLTNDEEEKWNRGWKTASLIQVYGKKAVLALAGRGVGPITAARILRKPHRQDQDFFIEILKAERSYARTRMFWD